MRSGCNHHNLQNIIFLLPYKQPIRLYMTLHTPFIIPFERVRPRVCGGNAVFRQMVNDSVNEFDIQPSLPATLKVLPKGWRIYYFVRHPFPKICSHISSAEEASKYSPFSICRKDSSKCFDRLVPFPNIWSNISSEEAYSQTSPRSTS